MREKISLFLLVLRHPYMTPFLKHVITVRTIMKISLKKPIAFLLSCYYINAFFNIAIACDLDEKNISFIQVKPSDVLNFEREDSKRRHDLYVNSFSHAYEKIEPKDINPHFKSREDVITWLDGAYYAEAKTFKQDGVRACVDMYEKGSPTLIGFAFVEGWNKDPDTLRIRDFAVAISNKGQGSAALLLNYIKDQWPMRRIILDTRKINLRARRFYEKHDFVELGMTHDPEIRLRKDATGHPLYLGLEWLRPQTWDNTLAFYKEIMSDKIFRLISSQHKLYKEGRLPKIADEEIKKIPIKESGEKLIDIKEANNVRIQMLPEAAKPFESPDHNSGFKAASRVRGALYQKLEKVLSSLDDLSLHFGFTPGQLSLKVFEGLRDLKTQEMLFNEKKQELHELNPFLSAEELLQETSKWVAPIKDNVPVHSTGGAVDIRLFDEINHKFIEMGPFGVVSGWWKGGNKTAPTFSEDLTQRQKVNRLFLLIATAQAGLINYPYEWWHFSHGDRYASFWLESNPLARRALYDSISE